MVILNLAYRRARDGLVVTGQYPDQPGDDWSLPFRATDAPFGPQVELTLSHQELPALTDWPAFWPAWREHRPETLNDLAALLDYLGVPEVTEEREREHNRQRYAHLETVLLTLGSEIEDGPTQGDGDDLPPDPHPDDYPPENGL